VKVFHVSLSNISKSLNYGIFYASGEFIARIDDDDLYELSKIEKQVVKFVNDTSISMLTTDYFVIDNNGVNKYLKKFDSEHKTLATTLSAFNPICHSSVMIRKSHLTQLKYVYDENKNGVEDFELWQRMILEGLKICNVSEPLTFYRNHIDQTTSRNKDLIESKIVSLCREYIKNLDEKKIFDEIDIRFSNFLNYYYNGFPLNALNLLFLNIYYSRLKDRRYYRYFFIVIIKLLLPVIIRQRLLNYLSVWFKKKFNKDFHSV